MKRLIALLPLLAICFLLASPKSYAATLPVPGVSLQDHIFGRRTAPVTLIVYSDFECPFCKSFHDTLKDVFKAEGKKVNIVYRHFPLPFHENALPAAEASECVAKTFGNGGFWTFVDAVFADGAAQYAVAAKSVGMSDASLASCMKDPAIVKKVQDQGSGVEATVTGTPTTIVLNRKTGALQTITGAVSAQEVETAIAAVSK